MSKELKEKAKIGFRKLWSNINKENQHLTTEMIEDFIDQTIDSAISQAVKEREEEIVEIILKNSYEDYKGSTSFLQSNTDTIIKLIKHKQQRYSIIKIKNGLWRLEWENGRYSEHSTQDGAEIMVLQVNKLIEEDKI